MLRISLICVFTATSLAQTRPGREIMSGSGTLNSGVTVHFKTILSPGVPPDDVLRGFMGGGIAPGGNAIHRAMVDRRGETWFGYDLAIQAGKNANEYLATFQAPTEVKTILEAVAGRMPSSVTPVRYPLPQVVHDGDIIELDLMASPDGKQKLTDYIEIVAHDPKPPAAADTIAPRDFTVDDGPITFDTTRMTIWVQGRQVQNTAGFTGKPGATFWIALPGQGRYILSLAPHEGFAKAGTVRGNVMLFGDAGSEYQMRFMNSITGVSGPLNLYVLLDPAYETDGIKMGTDRLENLLPAALRKP